jgi:isopentenyl-diphosphate Delta-isomerase
MLEPVEQPVNSEWITAIDGDGQLYPIEKLEAHQRNVPHLAISVFVVQDGKLLIQQRADHKYHSGGLWANTCCSHPRWNEEPAECAARRLPEEVGFNIDLTWFGAIDYAADVGSALYENEFAHCYVGELHDDSVLDQFNPDEVQAVRWVDLEELRAEVERTPAQFTKWLRIYLHQHYDMIRSAADRCSAGQTADAT